MAGHPHDALFKAAFSQPEHALKLLRTLSQHHPRAPELIALLEGASATLVPGTFVDASLAQQPVVQPIVAPRAGIFVEGKEPERSCTGRTGSSGDTALGEKTKRGGARGCTTGC